MIEIEHLNKTYPSPGGDIHALRDVNLRIEDGEDRKSTRLNSSHRT